MTLPGRAYTVEHKRDFRPAMAGADWRLHLSGQGQWCVGSGYAGAFRSREAADAAGRIWIETGLPPAEQTPERIERARKDNALLATAGIDPETMEHFDAPERAAA